MMKVRTRDFIYTTDNLFFASTNYIHPEDRFISFLRYIPDENGDRTQNGKKYSKVTSEEAYDYLRKNHPEYLYFCEVSQVEMMGVPHNKVKTIIKPEERLNEIIRQEKEIPSENPIIKKLLKVADFFHYKAGISYDNLGISGSILPNLQKNTVSDIDFVVYGLKNHRKAMETFKKFKDREVDIEIISKKDSDEIKSINKITLNSIQDSYWERIYNKRMKDSSLTKEEFCWYEDRKNNRGIIDGTLFDILATRNWNEIEGKWGDTRYEGIGIATIEATIEDAIASFDNPATYKIKDLNVLEVDSGDIDLIAQISELASFTHTYAGEAIEEERIIAKGKVEKVLKDIDGETEESYRLIVGTTRESIDEFIKLKNIPINKIVS
ncbi:DNA polymerase subunit beta [Methanobrevibacter sp. TMH8]|uniref:DNA polymerase subunit beta n=1 Tax=Methanobrevibacter sp. TMH8 TaxID=2848611 RepID=UPI001CCD5296|nr:DNA polymerase subunit beta [Methanobrevibacter sp. TMH8]